MKLKCKARETITPVEMNRGDTMEFILSDGTARDIKLLETHAELLFTTLDSTTLPLEERRGGRTFIEFSCTLDIDGRRHELRRELPTMRSFYDPWEIGGMQIWFDAVDDVFQLLTETHGDCRPNKDARFAVQDTTRRICPPPLHPWCPLPDPMDINRCYASQDCWLGPYYGAAAHGGLDINHPSGTPIWAPIDFDDQYFFNTVADGYNNNRHIGHHHWPDGSEWQLQCHHMTHLTVEENAPVEAGEQYASGAGVNNGYHEHSHFAFRVVEPDDTEVLLDPWILFWQMYEDVQAGRVPDKLE